LAFCTNCGKEISDKATFCSNCGATVGSNSDSQIIIVTIPTIPGYRITKVLGIASAITPRTRGIGGKFVAGIQSVLGGEVTAFTSELEKTRMDTVKRLRGKAKSMGGNAIVSLDMETTNLGLQAGIVAITATGTVVIADPIEESEKSGTE
jgi:uncharacterized protein YbjQ (UPF0145 family)